MKLLTQAAAIVTSVSIIAGAAVWAADTRYVTVGGLQELFDAQQEQEIQNGKDYLDSLAKESTEVADKLSLVFTSAAGNAITQFKSLKEIIKGIGADLLQLALQQTVLNPLKDVIGGALKGFASTLTRPPHAQDEPSSG